MALILAGFFIVAFTLSQFLLVTGLISTEERVLTFSAIILPGLVASGIYASRKFATDYEGYAWGITAFLTLAVFFGGFLYLFYLLEIGLKQTFFGLILYIFLLWLPVSIATGFSTQEMVLRRKVKKPFLSHVKRFAGRMILAEVVFLLVIAISSVVNLLAPFLPERYLVIIFIIANLTGTIALYIVTRNPRIGHFFSQLEKGEW